MINLRFERYKLNRELEYSGIDVKIYRYGTNEYGEPTTDSEPSLVGSLRCIYHEVSGYKSTKLVRAANENMVVRKTKDPLLLARYEDVEALGIAMGDVVRLSEGFKVLGWVNVQEWGIYAEISLERLDDGQQISL